MAETGAVFGGEHSGHFYFREFWHADSGMLAALHALAALGETDAGATLSEPPAVPTTAMSRAARSTPTVADQARGHGQNPALSSPRGDVEIDSLDGLTITAPAWWFNVRPSNTEPLLRLNVEADDETTMIQPCATRCSSVMRSGP